MTVFRSRNDDSAFIVLSDEVREHVCGHFGKGVPGSRFVMQSPDVLLQMVLDEFPDAINGAVAEADGRKRVSVKFPDVIGECNVVDWSQLTEEERNTMHTVARGQSDVRCVESRRRFPTSECQLVLSDDNHLITVYPGEAAPPLPPVGQTGDSFWDSHVFVVQRG